MPRLTTIPYLDVQADEDPYLDVHIDKDPYLEVQINEDPYLYYVHINDDSSPGCLQILSLNVLSSGAIVQQPGFSDHIGRRGNRADYTTDTMCVVFNAWLGVTSIHLKAAFI